MSSCLDAPLRPRGALLSRFVSESGLKGLDFSPDPLVPVPEPLRDGVASVHQAAQERYNLFISPCASQIDNLMVKGNNQADLFTWVFEVSFASRIGLPWT